MGYSKRQFIQAAFEEIGLASSAFDMQPDQIESALRRLDSMLAEWNGKGIRLGYPLPNSPQYSDIDAQSEVPDSAYEAIITNLAIRIAPSYGREVMQDTRISAKNSYNVLLQRAVMPNPQQFPDTLPVGAGNKPWGIAGNPFMQSPTEGILAGQDGELEF